jgi:hypothetical protein
VAENTMDPVGATNLGVSASDPMFAHSPGVSADPGISA